MSDITLEEQEPTALDFVNGLVEAFGYDADVTSHSEDDEAIEIHVDGDDLGLLVGPRGTTLASIAELTRTAVAQQHSGRLEGRLRVDVAGYRARRKEALERFTAQIAEKVLDTGEAVALEPMSPPIARSSTTPSTRSTVCAPSVGARTVAVTSSSSPTRTRGRWATRAGVGGAGSPGRPGGVRRPEPPGRMGV